MDEQTNREHEWLAHNCKSPNGHAEIRLIEMSDESKGRVVDLSKIIIIIITRRISNVDTHLGIQGQIILLVRYDHCHSSSRKTTLGTGNFWFWINQQPHLILWKIA